MNTAPMKYTVTNDSATVIFGGIPLTVKRGSANFEGLRKALLEHNWDEVPHHLRSDSSIERWASGKFKASDGVVSYNGEPLPVDLNSRLIEMASLGSDPTSLMKFWERLQKNPSMRSVEQLWRFLNNTGIPFTQDGCFLAYKAVRRDFKDVHSGTIENRPGAVIEMPRNKISDDPAEACHYGLHVGALEYASTFYTSGRIVICKVDPADVVCVPFDASSQKMRVCRYEVVGMHGEGHMPSTTIEDEDIPYNDGFGYDFDEDYDDAAYDEDYEAIVVTTAPVVAPVAAPLPKPVNSGGKRRSKEHKRLDALDESLLMQETYDTLRDYLSHGLAVVGASRIKGGKWAMVQAIQNARY